jgi:hypothetical protein
VILLIFLLVLVQSCVYVDTHTVDGQTPTSSHRVCVFVRARREGGCFLSRGEGASSSTCGWALGCFGTRRHQMSTQGEESNPHILYFINQSIIKCHISSCTLFLSWLTSFPLATLTRSIGPIARRQSPSQVAEWIGPKSVEKPVRV